MSDKADKECQCVCASKIDVVEGYPDHGFCITNINCKNKVFKARYYGAFGDGANTTGCYDAILWTVEADFNWCESGKFVGLPTTYDKVTATVRWKGTTPGTILTQPKNYDGVITGIPFEFDPGLGFGEETTNKGKFTVSVRNTGSASTDIYCNPDVQSQQRICYTLETELCYDGEKETDCGS